MWQFLIVFLTVLLLYFHLQFHWKTSNELDVAHVDISDKETLETIADLRQPFLFDRLPETTLLSDGLLEKVNIIRDNKNLEITHQSLVKLLNSESGLIKNHSFLNKSGYFESNKSCKEMSIFLRPFMTLSTHHDILFGSKGATSVVKENLNYRNYIYVLEGNIEVKLVLQSYLIILMEIVMENLKLIYGKERKC